MKELEQYINTVFKLPKVGDCFVFRKFMSYTKKFQSIYEPTPIKNQPSPSAKKNSGSFYEINSYKLDSLMTIRSKKLSNDLSEKI